MCMKHVPLFVLMLCYNVHSLATDTSHAVCNAAEVLFGVFSLSTELLKHCIVAGVWTADQAAEVLQVLSQAAHH